MNTAVLIVIAAFGLSSEAESPGRQRGNRDRYHVSGGRVIKPTSVPWNAALYRLESANHEQHYEQYCGGTLISATFVLTAAHCLHDIYRRHMRVALGKFTRTYNDTVNQDAQYFNVRRLIRYPRYLHHDSFLQFDIALVELDTPAILTTSVQLARVDLTPGFPANDTSGLVTGWGLTQINLPSEQLQFITMPYVDPDNCYQNIPSDNRRYLTADKFCAGYNNMNMSVCKGDSGAGFTVLDPVTRQRYVRGIVSCDFRTDNFPNNTCYKTHFTGFIHVGQEIYVKWLTEQVPVLKKLELATDCGRQLKVRAEELNGRNATVGDQPWHVGIYVVSNGTWEYDCTATLITSTHVVTSAWCTTDVDGRAVPTFRSILIAGKVHQSYHVSEPGSQTRGVRTVLVHPEFNEASKLHDIAVLVADSSFTFSWRISPACVDWTGQLPAQQSAIVTAVARGHVSATQPHALTPRGECLRVSAEHVHNTTLCARQAGEETCYITDGAGLTMSYTDRRGFDWRYLRGVFVTTLTATERDGCFYDGLRVFTDLAPYTSWLQRHVA